MKVEFVSLRKCKSCSAQLFKRDCVGHLRRHGLQVEDWADHFVLGPKVPSAPGDFHKPLNYRHAKKQSEDADIPE